MTGSPVSFGAAPEPPEALARVVEFFERLAPSDLARIGDLYASDATFKDPFNEVRGVAAIAGVFEHMFVALEAPRFVVHERLGDGARAFLTWDFVFRFRDGRPAGDQTIRGATLLHFDGEGRIAAHRDYWDAAEELYGKLPVIGALMRLLRRRVAG